MISASKLARLCAYPLTLSALPPRTAAEKQREENKRAAADRGKIFHEAIELWVKQGTLPIVDDLEIQGWLDLLMSQWKPAVSTVTEVAWGLTHDGAYVEVLEPEPHVYVAPQGPELLTAGRLDVGWTIGTTTGTNEPYTAACVDYKTGKYPVTPAHSNLQIHAGAIALAQRLGCRAYIAGIYYTRDGVFDWSEVIHLGSPEHAAIFAEIKAAALLDPGTPVPGETQCGKCWERKRCAHAYGETP